MKFWMFFDKYEILQIPGWKKEILTDSQHFQLKIPGEYDVRTKMLIIGATFLIEYMCYENTAK